ncbi:MAG: WxL domain-containing protein [Lactobacillales bacterium]|jgi:hypothetical protein|nr:WxL domain-containing protein [Lactobacillales bacterium]
MDFKNLKLPLLTVATLGAIAFGQVTASADPTQTDGKVTFEFDTEDVRIVQPGTNTTIEHLQGSTSGEAKVETSAKGFVQLLFAPNFDFGTVRANYKQDSTYSAKYITGSVEGRADKYLAPFAQVVDYSETSIDWNLKVELASQFTAGGHTLTNSTIKLHGDSGSILSDIANYAFAGASLNATQTLSLGGDAATILSHAEGTADVNGAKWSYIFGPSATYDSGSDAWPVDTTTYLVDKFTTDSTAKTDAIQLEVPASAKPKVGREYHANLLWTLSAVPEEEAETITEDAIPLGDVIELTASKVFTVQVDKALYDEIGNYSADFPQREADGKDVYFNQFGYPNTKTPSSFAALRIGENSIELSPGDAATQPLFTLDSKDDYTNFWLMFKFTDEYPTDLSVGSVHEISLDILNTSGEIQKTFNFTMTVGSVIAE